VAQRQPHEKGGAMSFNCRERKTAINLRLCAIPPTFNRRLQRRDGCRCPAARWLDFIHSDDAFKAFDPYGFKRFAAGPE
jgi:hypothetical protein